MLTTEEFLNKDIKYLEIKEFVDSTVEFLFNDISNNLDKHLKKKWKMIMNMRHTMTKCHIVSNYITE